MNITLLTSAPSAVAEALAAIAAEGLTVVDFSSDAALAPFCRSVDARHIPFPGWSGLAAAITEPGLLVSYKISKIIPMTFARAFPLGAVNIHPSLLPRHRGPNPWLSMYIAMDLRGGVTVHKITAEPDAGPILAAQGFPIAPGQPLPEAMATADSLAASLIRRVISERLYLTPGTPQPLATDPPAAVGPAAMSYAAVDLDELRRLPPRRLWHLLRGFPALAPILFPNQDYPPSPD